MNSQIIKSEIFTIYLYDTSRKEENYKKRYLKLLRKNLGVLDKWLRIKKASASKVPQIELSITLCGEKRIKTLNGEYRNKNKITDVISFPLEENPVKLLKKGNFPFPVMNLGDIFICREAALRQAREFQLKMEEELIYLGIHGLLHLFGYDHEKSKAHGKKMEEEEKTISQMVFRG